LKTIDITISQTSNNLSHTFVVVVVVSKTQQLRLYVVSLTTQTADSPNQLVALIGETTG